MSQLWVRRDAHSPWLVDLLLTLTDGNDWLYMRDQGIRRPLATIGFVVDDGVKYLQHEIVLLFKAKPKRSKDEIDFDVLPHRRHRAASSSPTPLATLSPDTPG
jgi:hypothetical protein